MAALALVGAAGPLAACGGDESPAPQGPPAARHGADPVSVLARVEELRSRLVAASDLYALRQDQDARAHLDGARTAYAPLGPRVQAEDPILDREIHAAFDRIAAAIARGEDPDFARGRIGLLGGQLMDAVAEALIAAPARTDAGVRAEVMLATTQSLERAYSEGTAGPPNAEGRRAVQRAYGLLARSQLIARATAGSLGPQKDAVVETLSRLRERAFPTGILPPPSPPLASEVAKAVGRVQAALAERFALRG